MGISETKEMLENALKENKKLSMQARDIISCCVCDFSEFFNKYNIELDYDNICNLVSSLNLDESNDISAPVEYDPKSNSFVFSKNVFKQEEIDKGFEKSVLSMITNVYSIETDKYNEGLTFDINGKQYGKIVNEKLKDRIVELTYGNLDDKIVTLPTTLDSLSMDFEQFIGSENLLTYFVNGRGDLMFNNIASLFNSEEECILFFRNLNRYLEVDPNDMRGLRAVDAAYENKKEEILQNKLNNTLAM